MQSSSKNTTMQLSKDIWMPGTEITGTKNKESGSRGLASPGGIARQTHSFQIQKYARIFVWLGPHNKSYDNGNLWVVAWLDDFWDWNGDLQECILKEIPSECKDSMVLVQIDFVKNDDPPTCDIYTEGNVKRFIGKDWVHVWSNI